MGGAGMMEGGPGAGMMGDGWHGFTAGYDHPRGDPSTANYADVKHS